MNVVKSRREELGIRSMREAARRADVPGEVWSRAENGETMPRERGAKAMAAVLGWREDCFERIAAGLLPVEGEVVEVATLELVLAELRALRADVAEVRSEVAEVRSEVAEIRAVLDEFD